MKKNPACRVCDVELNDENWYPAYRKANRCICKECTCEQARQWREANPEKVIAQGIKGNRKQYCPFNENKDCPMFLGVHIAERVLSKVFKDVEVMPRNHPGYDFICNKGKRIDVKSSCTRKKRGGWGFDIRRNTTADYFLCLAFDNREDLNPLHAWLIPGSKVNHLLGTTIRQSTIHKWNAYRLDITKILTCCNTLKK